MIYIVIPVLNRWQFTKECLLCLRNQTYKNFKTIVVDHGSKDGTSEFIQAEFPEVILLKGDESMWWAAATNLGVRYAIKYSANFIITLNNDVVVDANYIQSLMDVALLYPKSLVGSVCVNKNNSKQIIFAGIKWNKWTARYKSAINLADFDSLRLKTSHIDSDLLPGRGTLIPAKTFNQFGLFDEINFPHYAADEEFSNRCKKNGYKLLVSSKSFVKSIVEAKGIKNIHQHTTLNYLNDLFLSTRSPLNLKRRWFWARYNTPVPPFYFLFDLLRIIISVLKKNS